MIQSRKIASNASTRYSTVRVTNAYNTLAALLSPQNACMVNLQTGQRTELEHIGDGNALKWDRTDPCKFYYHSENILYFMFAGEWLPRIQHQFTEYSKIGDCGEADLSESGLLVLIGDDTEVFVYNPATEEKRIIGQFGDIDALTITPDNDVIISWDNEKPKPGIWLYREGQEPFQLTKVDCHKMVCRDTNGDPVMIFTDAAEADSKNSIVKIRLADGQRTHLLTMGWNPYPNGVAGDELAVHITASPSGRVFFETYRPFYTGGTWLQYEGLILELPLDGSAPIPICEHGSTGRTYPSQPKASAGDKAIVFCSDRDGQVDAWLAELQDYISPGPEPAITGEFEGVSI